MAEEKHQTNYTFTRSHLLFVDLWLANGETFQLASLQENNFNPLALFVCVHGCLVRSVCLFLLSCNEETKTHEDREYNGKVEMKD